MAFLCWACVLMVINLNLPVFSSEGFGDVQDWSNTRGVTPKRRKIHDLCQSSNCPPDLTEIHRMHHRLPVIAKSGKRFESACVSMPINVAYSHESTRQRRHFCTESNGSSARQTSSYRRSSSLKIVNSTMMFVIS